MKQCSTCKEVKPFSAFNKNVGRKDNLQSNCKECNRARSRKYYQENKEKHVAVTTFAAKTNRPKYVERNLTYIFEYLKLHPCVDCGLADIRVLEFDHVRGDKIAGVCRMAIDAAPLQRVIDEIAKCEVRCRNCHTIVTYDRLGGTWRGRMLGLRN